jgi:hypothetical protein
MFPGLEIATPDLREERRGPSGSGAALYVPPASAERHVRGRLATIDKTADLCARAMGNGTAMACRVAVVLDDEKEQGTVNHPSSGPRPVRAE